MLASAQPPSIHSRPAAAAHPLRAAVNWRHGWAPIVVLPIAVLLLLPAACPRWVLMWSLAFAIYAGAKWLTWRRTPVSNVALWKHLGYLAAWPGMDAAAFLRSPRERAVARPAISEWLLACGKFIAGLAMFFGAAQLLPTKHPLLAGWIGLIGIIFVLHFGIFHLLSCAWRSVGVDARPLMNWPIAATSVSEFWGRRWNSAFRDLCFRFVFRPFTAWFGPGWGMFIGFLVSGMIHDLVISVPAGAGFAGPTLFFGVQGAAMLAQRGPIGRRLRLGRGWRGLVFAAAVVVAPAYLLFHPPFIREVIVPMLHNWGGIS